MRHHKLLAMAGALFALVGCDPYDAYCAKMEQCIEEDEKGFDDIDADDDYRAVCAATLRGGERTLRANEEEECQLVADASRLWYACLAALDCDDLNDEWREPDKCEDERDDYDDAVEDAEDDCQTGISFNCASVGPSGGLAFALFALVLRARSRRTRRPA